MPLVVDPSQPDGKEYPQPKPGNQPAILVAIVDLGTVTKSYQNQEYAAHELYFGWELVKQPRPDGAGNFLVGRAFTRSLAESANLKAFLEGWRGRQLGKDEKLDLAILLGKACLLNVKQVAGKSFVKLDAQCAARLPEGLKCPPGKCKPFLYELAPGGELPAELASLPFLFGESIPARIRRSEQWKRAAAPAERVDTPRMDDFDGEPSGRPGDTCSRPGDTYSDWTADDSQDIPF